MRKNALIPKNAHGIFQITFLLLSLLFFHTALLAQNNTPVTVSGKVISDSLGSGLSGVSVVIKGTTSGTSTNAAGEFTLHGGAPTSVLVFSMTGYKSVELKAAQVGKFAIRLAISAQDLTDVVVTGFQNV